MGEIGDEAAQVEQPQTVSAALLQLAYEDKLKYCSIISQPMASKKLCKKLFKLIAASWQKRTMVNGVKGVQKAIRKGEKGKGSITTKFSVELWLIVHSTFN